MRAVHGAVLLLLLAACGRSDRPGAEGPQAAGRTATEGAWTWHPLGGLAVIEGEVGAPTELILEGRSIREHRYAEPGPVRWELFRPPPGEAAVLRTAGGRELARFTFSLPPAGTVAVSARRVGPSGAVRAEPGPKSASEPPAPGLRTEARLRNLPVTAIPDRKPLAIPSTAEVPVEVPHHGPTVAALLPDGAPLRPVQPLPPAVLPGVAAGGRPAWPGMGEALNLTRGPGGQRRLLLSFDGGSNATVATEVLDILKVRGVRTTLFLTGTFIQKFPALVKRMAAEGHELGNHTMNHPHFAPDMKRDPRWTRERVQRELLEADAALLRLTGRPMDPYWRAPYGEHTAEIRRWAEEVGYRHVGWSEGADTLDWATPKDRRLYRSGEAIVKRLEGRLDRNGDGLIVLMHLGSERALGDRPTDGLGAFMDRARNEGWTFVPVSAFLRDLGKPTWDPQQRLALLSGPHSQGR